MPEAAAASRPGIWMSSGSWSMTVCEESWSWRRLYFYTWHVGKLYFLLHFNRFLLCAFFTVKKEKRKKLRDVILYQTVQRCSFITLHIVALTRSSIHPLLVLHSGFASCSQLRLFGVADHPNVRVFGLDCGRRFGWPGHTGRTCTTTHRVAWGLGIELATFLLWGDIPKHIRLWR